MTDAEKDALREEEHAIRQAAVRNLAAMRQAAEDLEQWIQRGGLRPPPVDVGRTGFDLQNDVQALYRVRLWRQRFE